MGSNLVRTRSHPPRGRFQPSFTRAAPPGGRFQPTSALSPPSKVGFNSLQPGHPLQSRFQLALVRSEEVLGSSRPAAACTAKRFQPTSTGRTPSTGFEPTSTGRTPPNQVSTHFDPSDPSNQVSTHFDPSDPPNQVSTYLDRSDPSQPGFNPLRPVRLGPRAGRASGGVESEPRIATALPTNRSSAGPWLLDHGEARAGLWRAPTPPRPVHASGVQTASALWLGGLCFT